jgi:hypothetical protein
VEVQSFISSSVKVAEAVITPTVGGFGISAVTVIEYSPTSAWLVALNVKVLVGPTKPIQAG